MSDEQGRRRRDKTDADDSSKQNTTEISTTNDGDRGASERLPETGPTAVTDRAAARRLISEAEVAAELERRQEEAEDDWQQADGSERAAFAREVGHVEHQDWQSAIRESESRRGRIDGQDYGIEYVLQHPDGGTVRLDYVDFREDRIVDRKAQASDESDLTLARHYREQRERHVAAYRARFGRTPTYEYAPYSSTRDLYTDGPEPGSMEARLAEEMREAGPSALDGEHGPHPSSAALVEFGANALDPESARHVRAHLVFCDDCRDLVDGLVLDQQDRDH